MSSANDLQQQGIKLFQQRDYEAAARAFQQAHESYVVDGNRELAAEMQSNIGLVHRALGENQQALEMMQSALRTFQELGDQLHTAQALGNLGGVYVALSDKEQAYNCYRQAADMFEMLGEKKFYGETLLAMADLQVKDGKLMQGAATYEIGLENLDQLSPSQKVLKGLLGVKNKLIGSK
jgi:tetratricopeptide (TPR) repeat protein